MAIEDIKNYIEQNKDKHPVDVLLNQLRASGYPESEIQAYLSGKDGAPLPAQAQTQIQPQLSFLGKIGKPVFFDNRNFCCCQLDSFFLLLALSKTIALYRTRFFDRCDRKYFISGFCFIFNLDIYGVCRY